MICKLLQRFKRALIGVVTYLLYNIRRIIILKRTVCFSKTIRTQYQYNMCSVIRDLVVLSTKECTIRNCITQVRTIRPDTPPPAIFYIHLYYIMQVQYGRRVLIYFTIISRFLNNIKLCSKIIYGRLCAVYICVQYRRRYKVVS